MGNQNNDNQKEGVCMACDCPCDMHKEHNHDTVEAKGEEKESCMACSCPCETHKEHNHGV